MSGSLAGRDHDERTNGRDCDPFTAGHWNGLYRRVVIHAGTSPSRAGVNSLSERLFGRQLDSAEWAALTGAPNGADVHVSPGTTTAGLVPLIRVEHAWFRTPAFRFPYRDNAGRLAIRNESIDLRDDAPDYAGTRILVHQVLAARALGVAYLTAEAAGHPGSRFVGYYVWPRLGYTGPISGAVRRHLPPQLAEETDVLDLVQREGGAAWWRQYGRGFEATFDLTEGSRSLEVLAAYTRDKGIRA